VWEGVRGLAGTPGLLLPGGQLVCWDVFQPHQLHRAVLIQVSQVVPPGCIIRAAGVVRVGFHNRYIALNRHAGDATAVYVEGLAPLYLP
jgi:hypothetical protein